MKQKPGATKKRDAYLRKTYNITLPEYERLLDVYRGGCWLCRKPPKPGRNLAVDHCHKTAKETKQVRVSVRGLLCFLCNKRIIGRRRREHAYLYQNAYTYLTSDTAQDILNDKIRKE